MFFKSVARRALGYLTRHAESTRAIALIAVAVLFLFPLVWPKLGGDVSTDTQELLRKWATGVSAGYLAYEALRAWAAKRFVDADERIHEMMRKVLEEVDDACFRNDTALRLTTCRVKVWKVARLGIRERYNKITEPRLLLQVSTPGRSTHSSGVEWRVGKGVIGKALAENDVLGVDLDELWRPLARCSENKWNSSSPEKTLGLTFEEFRRIRRNGSAANNAVSPFVLAVPVYRGSKKIGVVALDTPPKAARAVRDSKADELLLAVGRAALPTTGA